MQPSRFHPALSLVALAAALALPAQAQNTLEKVKTSGSISVA